ncbi:hypothetical protein AB0M02_09950 [Actinoplanes sp. NPDC051861]|uniref:hypothetical protein n=1 Tax=Actinoplanes sp. NPDC051861 TaxID=3155170 RepID=UPI00342360CA
MERGPLALFGAIVAIGVGPALWLGAQLGAVNLAPNERPSTVGEQFPDNDTGVEMDFGGSGAGEAPENADPITRYTLPPAKPGVAPPATEPVSSPTATAGSTSPSASPSASPSTNEPEVEPSESETSTPPVESTEPTEEPEPTDSPTSPAQPEQ